MVLKEIEKRVICLAVHGVERIPSVLYEQPHITVSQESPCRTSSSLCRLYVLPKQQEYDLH